MDTTMSERYKRMRKELAIRHLKQAFLHIPAETEASLLDAIKRLEPHEYHSSIAHYLSSMTETTVSHKTLSIVAASLLSYTVDRDRPVKPTISLSTDALSRPTVQQAFRHFQEAFEEQLVKSDPDPNK
jgi:hypothetical protein